ncbi:hypothetical protein CC1G_06047 [Coprinopsis cinerea okayama7|uniref:Uncharacterized protein n=1 Tax=Coprinopsis cinerea (strain Okayama-7 / 130 / ATCC MYA-4618 / FGSC 9003) TaxID=240176 RepID=A8N4H0_COPC7|nr:hypothetical protein CC1G_06047 [Coprinopsis cinerea okayama7\|eukprot:XP_001829838.2 hypothetical protein CC1G_06047 [Coprinopsis cinerea okayama7\
MDVEKAASLIVPPTHSSIRRPSPFCSLTWYAIQRQALSAIPPFALGGDLPAHPTPTKRIVDRCPSANQRLTKGQMMVPDLSFWSPTPSTLMLNDHTPDPKHWEKEAQ